MSLALASKLANLLKEGFLFGGFKITLGTNRNAVLGETIQTATEALV